jgi:hypothetical protein
VSTLGVPGWEPEGVHGDLELAVELPRAGRVDAVLELRLLLDEGVHLLVARDLAERRLTSSKRVRSARVSATASSTLPRTSREDVELGLLCEVADARALGGPGLALDVGVEAGHDPEQGALPRSVRPHHADLGPG